MSLMRVISTLLFEMMMPKLTSSSKPPTQYGTHNLLPRFPLSLSLGTARIRGEGHGELFLRVPVRGRILIVEASMSSQVVLIRCFPVQIW